MNLRRFALIGLPLFTLATTGCKTEDFFFFAYLYNGQTGKQITGTKADFDRLELHYAGSANQMKATEIDEEGRVQFGPIPSYHDYEIFIERSGYRKFHSANPARLDTFDDQKMHTLIFSAYLFPTALQAPDAKFKITADNSDDPPDDGKLRLRPTMPPNLVDDTIETPPSVGGGLDPVPYGTAPQIWMNDLDLQSNVVEKKFEDGEAEIDGKDLRYGVTYSVMIYDMENYSEMTMVPNPNFNPMAIPTPPAMIPATFTAGFDGSLQSYVVNSYGPPPLQIAWISTDTDEKPDEDYKLKLVFNQDIEWDNGVRDDIYEEIVDNAFTINSPDQDGDGDMNCLTHDTACHMDPQDNEPDKQENGTKVLIKDNVMTFSWDDGDREEKDSSDEIFSVTYAALDQLMIRPDGGKLSEAATVASLLPGGVTMLTVDTFQEKP